MKSSEAQPFLSFIKAVSYTLKQFRLYSDKHPITRQALQLLDQELQKYFSDKKKITLGSMRKMLVVDGDIVGEKESSAIDLAKDLDRLGIEGLSFEKGIDLLELTSFLNLMAMRSKALEEKGGFKALFEKASLPHVRLTAGKYELVEEGQAVTSGEKPGDDAGPETPITDKGTGGGQRITSVADIINRIREDQVGGSSSATSLVPAQLDCEKIVGQLEKSPEDFVKVALESAQEAPALESVIRKVVQFLTEGLISFLVEQGKDITKALDRLARELEKAVSNMSEGPEFDQLKKKIPRIFGEAADELRVQMMVKAYQKNPEDPKTLEKMAAKIFKDEDVRKRLAPSLEEELTQAGLPSGQLKSMFGKIEQKEAKKKSRTTVDAEELEELRAKAEQFDKGQKKDGVTLDPKELAELRAKAEQFDLELDKRMKSTVQRLEREKKKLADDKERVDNVIRNLAEGVLVVDKQGKVVLMNPAAEKLLGVKQSDKIGKAVTEDLKEEHMVAMTGGNLNDPEEVSKRVEVISFNDETKRVLQASTAVIENENGQTVGMVSVLSDITRQRQLDELKNKFVANVSHDLRAPLVAIQKSLSILKAKELGDINEEQDKFLSIASRNMERLSRLIDDLLDISKLESGKMILSAQPVSIKDLLAQALQTFQTWAQDKKIKIETSIKGQEGLIEADPDRLMQILTNLVSNAMKFTPENGTITLEAVFDIKDSKIPEGVEIAVRDTGIGIAPEDQKRIFEKFEQVSLAQPSGVASTGLGLTIVKEIVELHGGRVWVESEADKGSRFAFRIPRVLKQG